MEYVLCRRDQSSSSGGWCPNSVPGFDTATYCTCVQYAGQVSVYNQRGRQEDLTFQCQRGCERLYGAFQVSTQCLRIYLQPGDDIPEMWLLPHLTSSSFPFSSSTPLTFHKGARSSDLGVLLLSSYCSLCLKHPSHILHPQVPLLPFPLPLCQPGSRILPLGSQRALCKPSS